MRIECLRLEHFRTFSTLELSVSGKKIGIVGENGLGKTNILESIYFLSQGSSWRTSHDSDVIERDSQFCRVSSVVEDENSVELAIALQRDGYTSARTHKRYFVNDIPRTKKVFTSYLRSILFVPEDILCITGSPQLRRSYLDRYLSGLDNDYHTILTRYQRVLTSRNKVLEAIREHNARLDQLDFWTEQMIELGSQIYRQRNAFFRYLIGCVTDDYQVTYMPNIIQIAHESDISLIRRVYSEHVEKNSHKEILSAHSQYGPHKDDFVFTVRGSDAATFASRGQQRSVLLWFIRAQLDYFISRVGNNPIVLLDDMFSELDARHRTELLTMFEPFQVFITGCEMFYFTEKAGAFDEVFLVDSGSVTRV